MLVRLKGSDTLAYQPMLATEWSNNADFSEWTFKIPAGVKFHDGTDCDAPAVVKSFQRFFQLGLGPVNVITRFVDKPEDITAPDATTVTFKLKSGNEIFLAAMASQYGPLVVSPAAMDANKTADDPYAHEWFRSNPVGTGPYKLKEYVQNDHITLERFEDFHGGWDGAHFDEVVFRIVVENATRRQLMETNQADASTQNLTPKDVTELEQAGKLQVLRYDSTNANWIALNAADKIKDVNARLAFCYAFPYDDVRQGVWDSLVVRTSGAMTPTTHGYDPNGFIFDTDLDKAKQLLDQSGFDKSQKLEFWLDESSETDKEMAQLFQANLQTLGIQMNVVTKEGGALTDFLYGNATAEERPAFFSAGWWPDYNDGYNELYPNFYSNSNQTSAGPNRQYYKNDRVDQILDTVGAGVPDDQYTSLLAEANKIMVLDDPASIFYGSQQWFTVMQPNIKGFISNPIYIGTYNLYDMYREA
jgi:peptide/nickel transport system substrate-binding protein